MTVYSESRCSDVLSHPDGCIDIRLVAMTRADYPDADNDLVRQFQLSCREMRGWHEYQEKLMKKNSPKNMDR